ncbi:glycoprotein 3-alpha-L-fucosyltransferase A-like [Octopus vulgaris]|uniref:Fucosyltransferase n=1 Tax=Octopus vulgaris TaxID=6645 RepID=A0AA36FS26_OCTVU|nr:glycoprotein 3-alpha-L-fucosyltransferase A-like [Octopus vulgaris]
MMAASEYGNRDLIDLLIEAGADLDTSDKINGYTALHYAVERRQRDAVASMISWGVDVNKRDIFGDTPLHLAARKRDEWKDGVSALLTPGKSRLQINQKNNIGRTPLHMACSWGRTDTVRLFLSHTEIDVNVMDNSDDTPLHRAVQEKHCEVVTLLLTQPYQPFDCYLSPALPPIYRLPNFYYQEGGGGGGEGEEDKGEGEGGGGRGEEEEEGEEGGGGGEEEDGEGEQEEGGGGGEGEEEEEDEKKKVQEEEKKEGEEEDREEEVRQRKQDVNYAKGKTKKVAWFTSNCCPTNNRMGYAEELGKYIQVDIYGFCGTKTCTKKDDPICFEMLEKEYKFYLAFENSNCRDYITEKFMRNALQHDVIPIVMGAHPDDYRKIAPENSYIHYEDFNSAKELAAYLHKLDKNDTLYNEYFKWKGTGQFYDVDLWCHVCSMLHHALDDKKQIWYENFGAWYAGKGVCIGKDRWT